MRAWVLGCHPPYVKAKVSFLDDPRNDLFSSLLSLPDPHVIFKFEALLGPHFGDPNMLRMLGHSTS